VLLSIECAFIKIGQTITDNVHMQLDEHDDDWLIFDVETDSARQFDLQSFCQ
jgi:hypothetical protein